MNATMDYRIEDIENLTEEHAARFAVERMEIKGHDVYFVDFGGYFGYSALVFLNGGYVKYANEYELHHKWRNLDHAGLKEVYVENLNHKLFTEEELSEDVKDYDEYDAKSYYIRNYYGMQKPYVSIFFIGSDEERAKLKRKTAKMIYNPVAFAYYDKSEEEFVKKHIQLLANLEASQKILKDDFDYWKSAFVKEMFNHEYGINWQADYDTLSAFGNIEYCDNDNECQNYFDQLNFTDTQRKAYYAAIKEYSKQAEF